MFQLRPATSQDSAKLSELAERVFCETFAPDNSPEDMKLYCDKHFGEAIQRAEIVDPQRHIVIAESGGEFLGYYLLNQSEPDPAVKGEKPIELVRLYVDFKSHGQGVAKALMEDAIQYAKAQGFKTLWLGVWETNFRAQKFYKKWNFENVGSHIFMMGADPQNDFIFARAL